MSDPQDRSGFVLPGVPRFGEIRAEGRIFTPQWTARRQAEKVVQPPRSVNALPRSVDAQREHAIYALEPIRQDAQRALGLQSNRPGGVAAR